MNDDPVRLSMVGRVLRRRWRPLLLLAVAGALVGVLASVLFSPGYRTSAGVVLQGPREQEELRTESQVAMSTVVLDRSADALGWDTDGVGLRDSVEAEVMDGNVIRITATADSPEQARQLADSVADQYVQFSVQLAANSAEASAAVAREQRAALRRAITATNERITDLHASAEGATTVESVQARTELAALRTQLAQAMKTLEESEGAAGQGQLVVLGSAPLPDGPAPPTMLQFAAGGAVLFALLGLLGHLVAARGDRRLREEAEIGAALGAPVLAAVDFPAGRESQTGAGPAWARTLRRVLVGDLPWNVDLVSGAGDEQARQVRLHRVLDRLERSVRHRGRILLLVPHDDVTARLAAVELVAAAHAGRRRAAGPLEIVNIRAERPTVPGGDDVAGVLVVLSTGTRTGWELVSVSEATTDAGHEVLGAMVVHRAVPERPAPAGRHSSTEATDPEAMAGSV